MTHIVPIVSILKLVKVLSFCPQFPDVQIYMKLESVVVSGFDH